MKFRPPNLEKIKFGKKFQIEDWVLSWCQGLFTCLCKECVSEELHFNAGILLSHVNAA